MKTKTSLALTLPIILAPILYGLAMYSRLPQTMATHWGINNQVNGTMPKAFMVFGLPVLMAIFQAVVILVPRKKTTAPRFERMVIWIMPVITIVAYLMTIQINLGHNVDIRRIAVVLVAAIMIAMGNYLPTVPAEYNGYKWSMRHMANRPDAKKVLRRYGYVMVAFGLLLLISIFFTPIVSAVILGIMIVVLVIMPFI
ncbi:DUF1648 domain-containing protein [Lacticaseibacillus porcinae]|uniref:DUF1648 domain-containing protein n=1 Tax=Lacticaseibacillus porcinae TaxID=1123687 RepID=UPI000F7B91EE|nr:DUF1648 domain-containing protein [Lacticaseibacillus porcinae]